MEKARLHEATLRANRETGDAFVQLLNDQATALMTPPSPPPSHPSPPGAPPLQVRVLWHAVPPSHTYCMMRPLYTLGALDRARGHTLWWWAPQPPLPPPLPPFRLGGESDAGMWHMSNVTGFATDAPLPPWAPPLPPMCDTLSALLPAAPLDSHRAGEPCPSPGGLAYASGGIQRLACVRLRCDECTAQPFTPDSLLTRK